MVVHTSISENKHSKDLLIQGIVLFILTNNLVRS